MTVFSLLILMRDENAHRAAALKKGAAVGAKSAPRRLMRFSTRLTAL